jgi:hypothetical protein
MAASLLPARGRVRACVPSAIVGLLLALLVAAPALAETSLTMTSDIGDYIGLGQPYFYDTSTGAFSASTDPSHQAVSVSYTGGSHWWYLDFAALQGLPLDPGLYTGATRYPFQLPAQPGLNVSGDGRGCNTLTGDFRVRTATFAGTTVIAFWAEFEQHCEGARPALRGDLRFNVSPPVVCRAPIRAIATAGRANAFAVAATHSGTTPAQLLAYGVPTGATFVPTAPDSAQFEWLPLAADQGQHLVSFVAVDSAGHRDSITTVIEVVGGVSLSIASETGDPIGLGQSHWIDRTDFDFTVRRYATGTLNAYVSQIIGPYESWSLDFLAAGNVAPHVGFYPDAIAYPAPGTAAPEIRISRNSSACYPTHTGEFQVKVADYGTGETVDRLWVRFAQRCSNGNGWLSGELRWNVAPLLAVVVPMHVTATVGALLRVGIGGQAEDGGPVTFGSVGLPAGASIVPAGPDSATLEWTPSTSAMGAVRFTIVGENSSAQIDSVIVTVDVTGESRFIATSDPGDPIGNGQSYDLDRDDGLFSGTLLDSNRVMVALDVFNSSDEWTFSFAAPAGGPIERGTYLDAGPFPGSATAPGMTVQHGYAYCPIPGGNFRVREIETGPGSTLVRFRADFEQHCVTTAMLRGEIRWNADVPLDLRAPIRVVGSRGYSLAFPVTATSATGATVTLVSGPLPAGATFDVIAGNGTLSWTPGPGQGGLVPITFVASASDGSIDSVVTWVQVAGVHALAIASEPGDPIGGGNAYYFTPGSATFQGWAYQGTALATVLPNGEVNPWHVSFSPPVGTTLAAGFYFDARGPSNPEGPWSLMSVASPSLTCYSSHGRFEIKQIEFSPGGALMALWARFIHRCDGHSGGLSGEVRFNADVRVSVTAPFEVEFEQGEPVAFAIKGTDAWGRPVTLSATGLPPGATFVDRGNDTGELMWMPDVEQFGRQVVVFHAVNPDGDADSVATEILLTGRRLWTMHSDVGDPIGGGNHYRFESDDATFSLSSSYDGFVYAGVDPDEDTYGDGWSVALRVPDGGLLAPGIYRNARAPLSPGDAYLQVVGPNGWCSDSRGQFRIRSAAYDSTGAIQSLRADFDHFCGSSEAGLHGSIIHRANAYVTVDAPIAVDAGLPEELTIIVQGADAGGGSVSLAALDLPADATFVDQGDGTGVMTWIPDSPGASLHHPRFIARNAAGVADTVTTEIRVTQYTLLSLNSDAGDPVGAGDVQTFDEATAQFQLVRNVAGGISATIDPDGLPRWELHFAPPAGTDLQLGDYPLALRYPFQEPSRPGLWVTSGASCANILGSFTIRHLEWGPDDEVESFWATFEQHCNGVTPALRGELIYNLDLAVPVQVSLVTAEAHEDLVNLRWFAAEHEGQPIALERNHGDDGWTPLTMLHADGGGHLEYTDRDVRPGERYGYRLVVNENGRDRALGEVWVDMPSPLAFALDGLRPNPSPGDLVVAFTLPRTGRARLQLLDVAGRAVLDRTFDDLGAGRHVERLADRGGVPAGVYLVRLEFEGERQTRTAIVVR